MDGLIPHGVFHRLTLTACQALSQASALTGLLTCVLLGSWHMLGAVLDAGPCILELGFWEGRTGRQTISWKAQPYML